MEYDDLDSMQRFGGIHQKSLVLWIKFMLAMPWLTSCLLAQPSIPAALDTAIWQQNLDQLDAFEAALDSLKTYELAHQMLEEAHRLNYLKGVGDCYKFLGRLENGLTNNMLTVMHYDSALYYYELVQDTMGMLAVLNNVGDPMSAIGQCTRAVSGYTKADRLMDRTENLEMWLILKFNHAKCLLFCGQYEWCIRIGENALTYINDEAYDMFKGYIGDLIGASYAQIKEPEKALQYFSMALEIAERLVIPNMESGIYNNMGNAFLELEDYSNAYAHYAKSLDVVEAHQISQNEDWATYVNLGIASHKLGNLKESLAFFERGLAMIKETENYIFLADSYRWASEAYAEAEQHGKAYELLTISQMWKDSVLNQEVQKKLQEITVQYENEVLEKELARSNLVVEKQRSNSRLYISLFIIALLFGALMYALMIMRQRQNRADAEQKRIELEYGLLRAQMNPHFIFNSLNSIQGFFAGNEFSLGNNFLIKFSKLIRRVLEQCNRPYITLAEEIETLRWYLDLEKLRLGPQLNTEIVVDPIIEPDLVLIPPLILQPFVENATWHGISPKSSPGTVSISLTYSENQQFLMATISDDGVGLTTEKASDLRGHQSKGIQITRERLGTKGFVKLNPKYQGSEPVGLDVFLKIPLIEDEQDRNN